MFINIETNEKAFTLIELLVVISIIGILTGVLYSIIDVGAVRRRAWDSSLASATDKMGLSVGGYVATYGAPPNGLEFLDLIEGESVVAGCTATDNYCVFSLSGHVTPDICSGNHVPNGGTGSCNFYFTATPLISADSFIIAVASFGLEEKYVGFSSDGGDVVCGQPLSSSTRMITSGDPGQDQCISAENY